MSGDVKKTKKIKIEFIAVGGLFLLLIGYLVISNLGRTIYRLPDLPDMGTNAVNRIVVTRPSGPLDLEQNGGKWMIMPGSYPADPSAVAGLTGTLSGLKLVSLVSEKKAYALYGLDDSAVINVKAYSGGKLVRDFDIGLTAPTYQHTFVKIGGHNEVYQAKGSFRGLFERPMDDMRDKSVMRFDIAQLNGIVLQDGSGARLEGLKVRETVPSTNTNIPPQVNEYWKASGGKRLSPEKMTDILSAMSSLSCSRFITNQKAEDLARLGALYTITVKGQKEYVLRIVAKYSNEYGALSSESPYPFILPDWQAVKLMPKFAEMMAK